MNMHTSHECTHGLPRNKYMSNYHTQLLRIMLRCILALNNQCPLSALLLSSDRKIVAAVGNFRRALQACVPYEACIGDVCVCLCTRAYLYISVCVVCLYVLCCVVLKNFLSICTDIFPGTSKLYEMLWRVAGKIALQGIVSVYVILHTCVSVFVY